MTKQENMCSGKEVGCKVWYSQMTLNFPPTEICCLKKGKRKGNDRGSDQPVVAHCDDGTLRTDIFGLVSSSCTAVERHSQYCYLL